MWDCSPEIIDVEQCATMAVKGDETRPSSPTAMETGPTEEEMIASYSIEVLEHGRIDM
jgi:hypothetical protein